MRTSLWACVLGLGLAPCAPASGQAPSASDAAPVYVDDSQAGRDAQREVDLLLSTGRIADAAVRLQAMIEAHGADLVESGPGAYVQASTWAARRLASDRRLLERYRARYEAEAGNALERGQAAGGYEPLEAVARRFPHTEAAQQARLWVAARRLEAGEAEAAWSILDEGQEQTAGDPAAAEHLTALRAVAAAMLGDERGSLAADAGADRTGQASAAVEAAADLLAPVALASPDLAEGGQPVWSRSWRRLLAERSLFESEFEPLTAAAAADRKSPSGVVVAGEHVVVTDGGAVAGIDLRSGALCWVYEPEPVRADVTEGLDAAQARLRARQLQQMRRGASTQSPGGVVIDGDTVYAVVNAEPESPRTGRRQGALAESRLVALDLNTGSLRWMRRASDWGDRLSFGWISGSPVVSSGRVCVAVRRLRGSGFGDTFVAAADAETGAPAWRRHISSVVQRGGWSVSGQAVSARRGALFVSDGSGVVGRLSARDGRVAWLRVLEAAGATLRRSSESEPPIPLAGGVLVRGAGPRSAGVRLDLRTGEMLTAPDVDLLRAERWAQAGEHVLGVGRRIVLYDGRTLEPLWSSAGSSSRDAAVWVGQGYALVSAQPRTLAVALDDGRVLGGVRRTSPAIAGGDGQCVVLRGDELQSLASWPAVQSALVQRAQSDDDPASLLGLARVALLHGEGAALQGAVVDAMAMLDAREFAADLAAPPDEEDPVRAVVFDQVLALAQRRDAESAGVRDFLLAQASGAARTASQAMRYHLAIGEHLSAGAAANPEEAAHHFQAVLADDALGSEMFRSDGLMRQARLEAASRLTELIRAHGPACYASFEAEAQLRFSELELVEAGAADYLNLSRRYPAARVAASAVWRGATRLAERGDHAPAVGYFRRAFAMAQDPAQRGAIASELAAYYRDRGQALRAARWLERVRSVDPGLPLVDAGQRTTAAAWLARLQASLERGDLASESPFRLTGRSWRTAGELLVERPGARTDRAAGFLIRRGDRIALVVDPDRPPRWVIPAPGRTLEVLAARRDQFVLWADGRTPVAIDADDGSIRWSGPELVGNLGDFDPETGQPQRFGDGSLVPAVRERLTGPDEARVGVAETVLIAVQPGGEAVGVDLTDGSVLWRRRLPGVSPDRLAVGDDLAVAVTRNQPAERELARHTLSYLEAYSGDDRVAPESTTQSPTWAGVLPGGEAVVAFEDHVRVTGALGPQTAWRIEREGFDDRIAGPAASSAHVLAVRGVKAGAVTTSVLIFDAHGQGFRQRVSLLGDSGSFALHRVGGVLVAADSSGLMAVGPDGGPSWRVGLGGLEVGGHAMAGGTVLALVQPSTPVRDEPGQAVWAIDGATGRVSGTATLAAGSARLDGRSLRVGGSAMAGQAGREVLLIGLEPAPALDAPATEADDQTRPPSEPIPTVTVPPGPPTSAAPRPGVSPVAETAHPPTTDADPEPAP